MDELNSALFPSANYELNGLITKLQDLYPGDQWKSYVKVTVSSTNPVDGRDPINLIDRSNKENNVKDRWCANPSYENPYFILSFPKFYVIPTYYMFLAQDAIYSRAWNVSISNNNKTWLDISTERDLFNESIKGDHIAVPFKQIIPAKHFKFTSFENNHAENDLGFCMRSVDIYGKVLLHIKTPKIEENLISPLFYYAVLPSFS